MRLIAKDEELEMRANELVSGYALGTQGTKAAMSGRGHDLTRLQGQIKDLKNALEKQTTHSQMLMVERNRLHQTLADLREVMKVPGEGGMKQCIVVGTGATSGISWLSGGQADKAVGVQSCKQPRRQGVLHTLPL